MRAFIFFALVAACCAGLIEKPLNDEELLRNVVVREIRVEVPRDLSEQSVEQIKKQIAREVSQVIFKTAASIGEEKMSEKVARDMDMMKATREIKIEIESREEHARHNFTRCIYNPVEKLFSCKGPLGAVECPVEANLTVLDSDLYKIFGLGKWEEIESMNKSSSIIERRFWLYPRKLDNSTYLNHTVLFEGKWQDLELYYSEKFEEYGMRITDAKCYERLVQLFGESNEMHMAKLATDIQVPLFGEALIVDRIVNKRWGWGWGWGGLGGWGYGGWGYGGWGYGGLGWGYPYYGWGK